MSIPEMQACLARLYLDELFRRLLARDPESALQAYGLSAEEEAAIRELDATRLEFFATSLKNKRRKRIARAFPLLFRVAADEVEHQYNRYHALYMPKSRRSIHQDVLDFGEFIEDSLAIAPGIPPWACDVARYERLLYATTYTHQADTDTSSGATTVSISSRPRLCEDAYVAEFQYDIASIEDALRDGEERGLEPSPCAIVSRAKTPTAEARVLRINGPTLAVLRHCDGRQRLEGIITEVEADFGTTGLKQGVFEAVTRLANANVLVIEPEASTTGPSPRSVADAPHERPTLTRECK